MTIKNIRDDMQAVELLKFGIKSEILKDAKKVKYLFVFCHYDLPSYMVMKRLQSLQQ